MMDQFKFCKNFSVTGSANHLCSKEKLTPDDELLEIINDFKNNVFTIKEVEKLVEEWQNRSDVQQSFKEKQVSYHLQVTILILETFFSSSYMYLEK